MSTKVGAPTKGLVKNNSTGEIRRFQFNPSEFQYSRSATYATIEAPGMAYPETQFVKGDVREFSITLFMYDLPHTGMYVKDCIFYGSFLTPEVVQPGYTKPPEMTFSLGSWVRTCVLTNLDISVTRYDGDLNPVQYEFTLDLRQVSV